MNFLDTEGNEAVVHEGDFVALYQKPNEYLAFAIQTAQKKMLRIIECGEVVDFFLIEKSLSIEDARVVIEHKIGFKLLHLEGEEKKHKENNLAQFAYSFIPSQNKQKNIITTVFKIGNLT